MRYGLNLKSTEDQQRPHGARPASGKAPLRIMPLGDSITAGYTDNPAWTHPFEFGYRSGLCKRMREAGWNFVFTGKSAEPFNGHGGDPTRGGSVKPVLDLRTMKQDGHRGYGGWRIPQIREHVAGWMAEDRPDLILLLIGINGICAESPEQLDQLVKTIFDTDPAVGLIVAQITPRCEYNEDLVNYNARIRQTLVPAYADRGCRIDTVDMYRHFLTDPDNPGSIDPGRLSNGINHPTNLLYDRMADSWFQKIRTFVTPQEAEV